MLEVTGDMRSACPVKIIAIRLRFYPFNTDNPIRDISIYKYRLLYFKVNTDISIWNTNILLEQEISLCHMEIEISAF